MRRGKLNNFGWLMVLAAGIFQILTLILDQSVIQMEEKNRINNYDMTRSNEVRFSYLEISRRADDINLSHSNILWINEPASFKREKREYIYFSILFDQTRLLQDIFRDDDIKNDFKDKIIKMSVDDNPDNFKELNYKEFFDILIKCYISFYIV